MNNHSQSRILPAAAIFVLTGLLLFMVVQKQPDPTPDIDNWRGGWRETTPFQIPRRAPAAAIAGNVIYVLGGVDNTGQYAKTVEYSLIKPDGNLGEWKKTSDLLEGRFYLGAMSDGEYLYALGGGGGPIGDHNIPLASVERAKINTDGSLGEWQHHSYLTTPRRGLKVENINNHVYAIGGYNGRFLRSTERLDLNTVPRWEIEQNESRVDRYIHASTRVREQLYLLGGHVEKAGSMSYGDIETARVRDNGSLAPWKISPSRLIEPRFIATAFSLDQYLYLVGGHNGVRRLNSVEMASVSPSGDPGGWTLLTPLNYKRSAAASVVTGHRVYVLGGMDDNGVLRSVETATLGPEGQLGEYVLSP